MSTNSSALIVPATDATNAPAELRDIRPPVEIPSGWEWLWWTLGAIAVAALAWWAWRRWQKKRNIAIPPLLPLPHVIARGKLREAEQLLHDPNAFCVLVSNTIRQYLEARFSLHAPDRTTEEFLLEVTHSPQLSAEQKQTLGSFLEACDLVKFARFEPTQEQLAGLLGIAHRLVDETEPTRVEVPGAQVTATESSPS
jgi:hypothetical protein